MTLSDAVAVFHLRAGPSSPGVGSFAITPDDNADLPQLARKLYVTGAGTVTFVGIDGTTDTWTVPDHFFIRVAVQRVKATGTTATGIKGIA